MKAKKFRGFMVLPAVLMSILLGLLGLSFLQIYSGQFSALSANKSALQAAQFAEAESDFLRNLDYTNIASGAHARKAISGATGWQSQVTLGSETTVNGVKQRMATVNVFRNSSVITPDFSLQVPLSSSGSGGNYYVKNLNQPSKTIAIKYNSETEMLYGDVDGKSTPFQSYLLVPDYAHGKNIINHQPHLNQYNGEYIQKHLDHPYLHTYAYGSPWTWEPNPAMSWEIPEHGYIHTIASLDSASDGIQSSYMVVLQRDGRSVSICEGYNISNTEQQVPPTLTPVRKGDIIYWGTRCDTQPKPPKRYSISFYPCLKELS